MKKFLIYFFVISSFISLLVVITVLIIDKREIVQVFKEQFNKNSDYQIEFDDNIHLALDPFPNIEINNLKIKKMEKNRDLSVRVKKAVLVLGLNLSKKNKIFIKKLNLNDAKILLNFNESNDSTNFNNLKISVTSNLSKRNNPFVDFEKIILNKGELLFRYKENNFKFENINFAFKSGKINTLKGYLKSKILDSDIDFFFKSKDFVDFDIYLKQYLSSNKDLIEWKLRTTKMENFKISGEVVSESLNLERIFNPNFLSKKNSIQKIAIKNPRKNNFNFDISFYINKSSYQNLVFENIYFQLTGDEKNFKIHELNCIGNGSNIMLNTNFDLKAQKIYGQGTITDYKIPISLLGKTKFDIFGGTTKINFNFVKNNIDFIKNFQTDLIVNSKIFVDSPNLSGIDLRKITKELANIKNFSSILNFLNLKNMKGVSKLEFLESDLEFFSNKLRISNLFAKNESVYLSGFGQLNLKNHTINMEKSIGFIDKKLSKYPEIKILVDGSTNKPKYRIDLEDLKKNMLVESLNKILENENKITINPSDLLEKFKKNNTKNLENLMKELF